MAKSKNPIPEGFHTLTVHASVTGAADYIDFLKRAFNAVEVSRMPGPGGKIMHAQVRVGDTALMLNDNMPEFGMPDYGKGPWPFTLHLYVPDVDAAYAQATAAGCQATMPVADQFWGDRYGQVRDPFGITWSIATHTDDFTPEEISERMAKMSAAGK